MGDLQSWRTPLLWAVRALRRESIEFQFDFSIEVVPNASQKGALHYHVHSDQLFLDNVEFDGNGVPMRVYRRLGPRYNPVFVAWWGLVRLRCHLLASQEQRALAAFYTQLWWLKKNAIDRADGAIVWPCYFDWQEGRCLLKAPWISAMYQGVVMSALVRGYRLTGDGSLLSLCEGATRVFEKSIEDGGVRTTENGAVLYEEYPGHPLARVLDGFLFSLLGLYDVAIETESLAVRRLFDEGVVGLLKTIDRWDYRGKWSWYGTHGYLCPPHYHQLNRALLTVIANLSGESNLMRYVDRWDAAARSTLEKLEIFCVFTITKNLARLRLPRN